MIAFDLRVMRRAIPIASQQAVEPSYIEALATSQPSSRATWVWNSNSTCSVPWAISGWFAKLKVADKAEYEALMDRAAYEDYLGTL